MVGKRDRERRTSRPRAAIADLLEPLSRCDGVFTRRILGVDISFTIHPESGNRVRKSAPQAQNRWAGHAPATHMHRARNIANDVRKRGSP